MTLFTGSPADDDAQARGCSDDREVLAMKRWLLVSRTIDSSAETLQSQLINRAEQAFKADPKSYMHADGSIAIHLPRDGFGSLNPALRVRFGVLAHRPDGRAVVPLMWEAEHADLAFPHFEGCVELEPLATKLTRVALFGHYVPPLGPLGAVVDAAILSRAAESTADALLDRIVEALGADTAVAPAHPPAILVREVMTANPFTVHPDLPLRTAALMLFHLRITGAPVVDDEGALLGVVTDRDLLDKEGRPRYGLGPAVDESWRRREATTVGKACSRPARVTAPDVRLRDCVTEMQRLGVGRLVVVEGGRVVGIVTRRDVLKSLIRTDADLHETVSRAMEEIGESAVSVNVEWGTVSLAGIVGLRSDVARVLATAADVDGVMHVDSSLTRQVDDVSVRETTPLL